MKVPSAQIHLPGFPDIEPHKSHRSRRTNGQANKLDTGDRAFHDWYRFVLSFPPHLVANYIESFGLNRDNVILDPFCGTGTTLVAAKLHNVQAIGLEANPFPQFASSVKVNWDISPEVLLTWANEIASTASNILHSHGITDWLPFNGTIEEIPLRTLRPETSKLLIKNSISPLPLHKSLVLLDCMKEHVNDECYKYGLLALGNSLAFSIGNLRFGPEVGVGKIKTDSPVIDCWLAEIAKMTNDLRKVANQSYPEITVHLSDARKISEVLEPRSIDAVITSPPYPNEKDYTRTTRLESVVLGFMRSKEDLRSFKKTLIRSNTRGVYKGDSDDAWIATHLEIQRVATEIEKRRIELGKTSGFERLYSKVTQLYFGGMTRHLTELRSVLRPGAQLAYVVGDQASYLRVMIRTGELLADIAQMLGYELVQIDLFRTRFATATQEQLREEVVVLRWPG